MGTLLFLPTFSTSAQPYSPHQNPLVHYFTSYCHTHGHTYTPVPEMVGGFEEAVIRLMVILNSLSKPTALVAHGLGAWVTLLAAKPFEDKAWPHHLRGIALLDPVLTLPSQLVRAGPIRRAIYTKTGLRVRGADGKPVYLPPPLVRSLLDVRNDLEAPEALKDLYHRPIEAYGLLDDNGRYNTRPLQLLLNGAQISPHILQEQDIPSVIGYQLTRWLS